MDISNKNVFEMTGAEKISALTFTKGKGLTEFLTEEPDEDHVFLTVEDARIIADYTTNYNNSSYTLRKNTAGVVYAVSIDGADYCDDLAELIASKGDRISEGLKLGFTANGRHLDITIIGSKLKEGIVKEGNIVSMDDFNDDMASRVIETIINNISGDWYHFRTPAALLSYCRIRLG